MPGPSWANIECMEVSQSLCTTRSKQICLRICTRDGLHMATLGLSSIDCRVDCQRFFLTLETSMCQSGKPHYLKSQPSLNRNPRIFLGNRKATAGIANRLAT
jgi:hypothetical protein